MRSSKTFVSTPCNSKLDVHKTFTWRPEYQMNFFCTFNLHLHFPQYYIFSMMPCEIHPFFVIVYSNLTEITNKWYTVSYHKTIFLDWSAGRKKNFYYLLIGDCCELVYDNRCELKITLCQWEINNIYHTFTSKILVQPDANF